MSARQNNQSNQGANFPTRYAQYGQFVVPAEENFWDRTLNAMQYMDDMQTAARGAYENGGSPMVAGMAAIAQRKHIRDAGKAYALQEQRKRQEIAKWANAMPEDARRKFEQEAGLPPGSLDFGSETFLTPDQIGNIQYNIGNYRQQNMGKLPVYGPMAPATQTGPSVRENLKQRAKAANLDYAEQQMGGLPFQAGQQASGINHPQVMGGQASPVGPGPASRSVPVGRGQTMQMQADPYSAGMLGMVNGKARPQIGDQPSATTQGKPVSMTPGTQAALQVQGGAPSPKVFAAGVQKDDVQVKDIDPSFFPTDYPTNMTRLYSDGAKDAQETFKNRQTAEKNQIDADYKSGMLKLHQAQQKLREMEFQEKKRGGMFTRPQPRGSAGPSSLVERALAAGIINKDEARAVIMKGIEGARGKGKKDKPPGPQVLEALGSYRKGVEDNQGFGPWAWGGNKDKEQYYRDMYDNVAGQYNLPRLPQKGGGSAPATNGPMTAGEWNQNRKHKKGGH